MSQGPIAVSLNALNPSSANTPVKMDTQSNLATFQGHGDFYGLTKAARGFYGASQTGATLSAGLATTYTGLCLSNPATSGVNLSILRVSACINVAPAALTAFGLITGWSLLGVTVHTTALTLFGNSFLNGAASAAKLDAACTIVGTGANAPQWNRWLGETATTTSSLSFSDPTNGSLLIPPGGYVAIGSSIAGPTAGLLGSFQWEEIAV